MTATLAEPETDAVPAEDESCQARWLRIDGRITDCPWPVRWLVIAACPKDGDWGPSQLCDPHKRQADDNPAEVRCSNGHPASIVMAVPIGGGS